MSNKREFLSRWENEGGMMATSARRPSDAELEAWGITIVTLVAYDWGGYRYSNIADALAAAARGRTGCSESTP